MYQVVISFKSVILINSVLDVTNNRTLGSAGEKAYTFNRAITIVKWLNFNQYLLST